MRIVLFIAVTFFFSCNPVTVAPCQGVVQICDSLQKQDANDIRRIQAVADSIQRRNDTLLTQLFLAKYKVEKVRYYLNICIKNKSQNKYLIGWIKRAIE